MKRNQLKRLCLLPLLVAACSPMEQDPQAVGPEGNVPFSVYGIRMASSTVVAARAEGDNVVVSNGSIGVFLTDDGTNAKPYNDRNNVKYNGAAGVWSPAVADELISLRVTPAAYLWAVHPYHASRVGGESYANRTKIPLKCQPYSVAEDLCYGSGTNAEIGGSTSITAVQDAETVPVWFVGMNHAYAKMVFKFKKNMYTGVGQISKIRVANVVDASTLDITTGAVATTQSKPHLVAAEMVSLALPADEVSETVTTDEVGNLLLVPIGVIATTSFASIANCGLKVTIVVDGEEYFAGIPVTTLSKLEAGKIYTVTLTIQGTANVSIGEVITAEWTSHGSDISGGGI